MSFPAERLLFAAWTAAEAAAGEIVLGISGGGSGISAGNGIGKYALTMRLLR